MMKQKVTTIERHKNNITKLHIVCNRNSKKENLKIFTQNWINWYPLHILKSL